MDRLKKIFEKSPCLKIQIHEEIERAKKGTTYLPIGLLPRRVSKREGFAEADG